MGESTNSRATLRFDRRIRSSTASVGLSMRWDTRAMFWKTRIFRIPHIAVAMRDRTATERQHQHHEPVRPRCLPVQRGRNAVQRTRDWSWTWTGEFRSSLRGRSPYYRSFRGEGSAPVQSGGCARVRHTAAEIAPLVRGRRSVPYDVFWYRGKNIVLGVTGSIACYKCGRPGE